MASGCEIDDCCREEFKNIKMGHQYRYVIFKLTSDYKKVDVEKTAPCDKTYDDLVADLKEAEEKNECRFAVFDFQYQTNEGCRDKLAFLYWSPEKATVKQKMVYSATCKALTHTLQPGIKSLQLNDHSDLVYNDILEKL